MKHTECDVAIVGAGVSGLAAAAVLGRAGKNVRCLEAGDRVGGRILTVHDPLAPLPIELGAEFVHGRPPETWELIRSAGLTAYEHSSEARHIDRHRIIASREVGEIADKVLSQMAKSARKKDESFEDYLGRSRQGADVKAWARVHIEGFNAARKDVISAASLTEDSAAAEKIDGDRSFRILNGYDSIAASLLRSIPDYGSVVQLSSVVTRVRWRHGSVEIGYKSALDGREATLRCEKVIVTIPLGVLQAALRAAQPGPGVIQFDPEPPGILKAARTLQFGKVYRVTFRFHDAFWDEDEKLKRAGFLISKDPQFFAWWTMHPIIAPLLTAWCAGSAAEQFLNSDRAAIVEAALASLERILKRTIPRPEAAYFNDWQSDPFFRGAYSYAPVNGLSARETLAKPVEGTLFFAGEGTETQGHSGTVHGAIASGLRAGAQALAH